MGAAQQKDSNLTVRLLGGFSAEQNGAPLDGFESERARALLAYLLVEADGYHQRERLAGLLWPELPEMRARQNLSQALYNLRNLLGDRIAPKPYLLTNKTSIAFNRDGDSWLDVDAFQALLSKSKNHNHPDLISCAACLGWLGEALALYQGEFLAGFSLSDSSAFEEWCLLNRERLRRQALEGAGALITIMEAHGDLAPALDLAWKLVEWDPYNESALGALLRLLVADGQPNLALAKYQEFQRLLAEELGVEAGAELSAFAQSLRADAAAPAGGGAPPHNLPPSLTPFVGRKMEIKEIAGRLKSRDCRLLSLVGPGGSGKTTLALQIGHALHGHYPDGVYFVPLGALGSVERIPTEIGAALEISFQEKPTHETQILDYLRDKSLLLILDSFDRLLDGARYIEKLLQAAPEVKILLTSRLRLNTRYETCYQLSGLGVPAPTAEPAAAFASEAVQLFLSGAMRAQAGYSLADGELGDVVEICRLVGGMPLGILLASSWVALFTPAEIAARIRDNLDFLAVDWVDLPERLRSLRATFNYSWDLLTERERVALGSLSVFRGGFTLGAAQQVTGCTPRELLALMDKSLLSRTLAGRFEVHELVRQYAAEKLSQRMSIELGVRDRHCTYYLGLLADAEADLKSTRQAETLGKLDLEAENLRQAWRWGADNEHLDLVTSAINGLCLYEALRWRYQEGERACHALVEKIGAEMGAGEGLSILVRALAWCLYFNCSLHHVELAQAQWDQLHEYIEKAEAHGFDVRWERALAWLGMGLVEKGLLKQSEHLQRSLELFRELSEDWWSARVLMFLGINYSRQGDYPLAIHAHEQGLALRRTIGIPRETADTLRQLSYAHAFHGRLELAYELMQEAAKLYKSLGTPYGEASAARHLGIITGWLGHIADSCTLLEESLPLYKQIGLRPDGVVANSVLGLGKMHLGEFESARSYAQTALDDARQLGVGREIAISLLLMGLLDLVAGLPEKALGSMHEGVAIYRAMGYSHELDYALACLGLALREVGQAQAAREALCEALALVGNRGGGYLALWLGIPLAALLLADAGELESAVEVWTLASQLPLVAKSRWVEQVVGQHIQALVGSLSPKQRIAAEARGKQRDPYQAVGWLLELLACEPGT